MTSSSADAARPAGRPPAPANWRARFLAGLADSSNVREAADRAGVCPSRVYKTKRTDRGFAEAWLIALCEGYDRLELELLSRLRSGEGRATGDSPPPRFDNATALRLLLAHRDTRARQIAQQDSVSAEAVRASIEEKLARLRARVLEREAAERAAAERKADEDAAEASGHDR